MRNRLRAQLTNTITAKKRSPRNVGSTLFERIPTFADCPIEVTYLWRRKTADRREITSVTVLSTYVPRPEESVDIDVKLEGGKWAGHFGTVAQVTWQVTSGRMSAKVFLH